VDENGWHELADGKWLWVCTTPTVTVFLIFDNRSGNKVERLLGKDYAGIIGSDRYRAPMHGWICANARCVGAISSMIFRR